MADTDIGGFRGADSRDGRYRELLIHWFQYGALVAPFPPPLNREPRMDTGWASTAGPNEIWPYSDTAYTVITDVVHMRERLRPYLHKQLD